MISEEPVAARVPESKSIKSVLKKRKDGGIYITVKQVSILFNLPMHGMH